MHNPAEITWVMNTETTAASLYTNFSFDSMAHIAGNTFAVDGTGIYLIAGDSDLGSQIDASLESGLMDFKVMSKKRLENVYFGYDGGPLKVKIEAYDAMGDAAEFTMPAKNATSSTSNRIKLAKGVVSWYYRLTVENLNGARFNVDDVDFDVAISSRKI